MKKTKHVFGGVVEKNQTIRTSCFVEVASKEVLTIKASDNPHLDTTTILKSPKREED